LICFTPLEKPSATVTPRSCRADYGRGKVLERIAKTNLFGSRRPSMMIAQSRHREKPMRAYYIAEHIITDPSKFEEYRVKVLPMIEKYGGRYLTKG
jgi:hypothetical protein